MWCSYLVGETVGDFWNFLNECQVFLVAFLYCTNFSSAIGVSCHRNTILCTFRSSFSLQKEICQKITLAGNIFLFHVYWSHRITEWFGAQRTFKSHLGQPPVSSAGEASTRSGWICLPQMPDTSSMKQLLSVYSHFSLCNIDTALGYRWGICVVGFFSLLVFLCMCVVVVGGFF